ncbi:response regulator transcription factor [Halovenus rubra]|uniref:Response regulator transcription factor n=2 Tax=Halovenus rubra TaxID=869890 RepID=A0ACC7E0W5_9EURY
MSEDTPTKEPSSERREILIVEDEVELADMYAAYLEDEFAVTVAYSGEEAIETVDDEFDIVLLDRRMPVVSGTEVLAHIEEQKLDCRVAMVTAVNPDFDIIDLRIDDYLIKPVSYSDIRETVERLNKLEAYNSRMQKLTSKKLKRNVLELEKTRAELSESDEFEELTTEIETLETEVEAISDDLDTEQLQNQR